MPRPEIITVDTSRQNYAQPGVNERRADDGKSETSASNHPTMQAVGATSRFRLPPRHRLMHEDERVDVQGTKLIYQTVVYTGPKLNIPSYEPVQRTGRHPFHIQYHPTNHLGMQRAGAAAGTPHWSSWTSAVPVETTTPSAWRQPHEMTRGNMGSRLDKGIPPHLVRHEASTTAGLKHSNAATFSPTINAPSVDTSHHRPIRISDPSSSANFTRHPPEHFKMGAAMHPRTSFTTVSESATQTSTSTSIKQRAYSNSDIGWHHRIGNVYAYRTLKPPPDTQQFISPSVEESKLPPNYHESKNISQNVERATNWNPTTPQPEKRVLSPLPQEYTNTSAPPQFKKAKGFDKLDLLCTATLEIGELHDNPTGCSCPKSKCVALYCDCFKAGRRCHPDRCSCLDCKNTIAESGVDGARTKAIRSILARNPRAFTTAGMGNPLHKLPPGEIACNCVHSRCLKLYCSCFHNGKICNPSICTCVRCGNTSEASGDRLAAIQHAKEKRADAFVIKPKVIGQGCACKNNRCLRKYCECFRTELHCTPKCRCRECENRGVTEQPSSSNEIVHLATTISSNSSEE